VLDILSVLHSTPASLSGLKNTDRLISCNDHELNDWIDFLFYASSTLITLKYKRGHLTRNISLRRNPGVEWGFVFNDQAPSICRNKCIFCFVDQLPSHLRPSLLLKDDDVRHSFVHGTYVTLDRKDTEYAIRKHLSPLHISVHSTDASIRGRLLGTKRMKPIKPMLEELSEAGIEMETQVVVVPGLNDGKELDRTLSDLFSIPSVVSVGVVPVGLTEHRDGLPKIRRSDSAEATEVVKQCNRWRIKAMKKRGNGWVYPSDEFFIMAGLDIPPLSYYSGCTLRANGIGLLADLLEIRGRNFTGRGVILTGKLAAPFLEQVLRGSDYTVNAVENTFLGPEIGVAGLLSGTDIVEYINKLPNSCNSVILPSVMFNNDMVTLDDFSPLEIRRLTGREILVKRNLEELT